MNKYCDVCEIKEQCGIAKEFSELCPYLNNDDEMAELPEDEEIEKLLETINVDDLIEFVVEESEE